MTTRLDTTRPAVVIAGFALSALGIVRCLERHGLRCWVLAANTRNLALKTRLAAPCLLPSLDADALGPHMHDIRDRCGSDPVIFTTEDHIVQTLSEHRAELACGLETLLPPQNVLAALMSKTTIGLCFARAGIDYPRTCTLTLADNASTIEHLRYPAILKPETKPPGYLRRFRKAYIVHSPAEALEQMHAFREFIKTVIVQEYIAGPDSEIFFCLAVRDRDGTFRQSFVGRKLASWPIGTGNTVACVPAPKRVASEIRALTDQFFRANGFFGIGSVEYKRAPSGRIFGLEPTVCRVNAQSEIAVLNGVDLPLAYYCMATGQSFPAPRKVRPTGWLDPFLKSHLENAGGWHPPPAGTPPLRNALWRWYDPGPWIAYHRPRLRHWHRALTRRLNRLFDGK